MKKQPLHIRNRRPRQVEKPDLSELFEAIRFTANAMRDMANAGQHCQARLDEMRIGMRRTV